MAKHGACSSETAATTGSIEMLSENYMRARVQRRTGDGRKMQIRGPRRGEKRKAEEDLDAIREAAQGPDTWSAMGAEAHRLQEQAEFEGRVRAYVVSHTCATHPNLPTAPESQSTNNKYRG